MKLINLKLITFTLLFGILINPIFSQEIVEKPISEFKSPGFSCKYKKNGNTDGYIYIGYQNPDYTTIIDIISIMLSRRETVENHIKDLESSLTYLGTNQTVRYTKNNSYKILVYDFWKKGIYIGNHKDKEYRLYKKYLIKYIDWLKSLDLKYIPKLDGSY